MSYFWGCVLLLTFALLTFALGFSAGMLTGFSTRGYYRRLLALYVKEVERLKARESASLAEQKGEGA